MAQFSRPLGLFGRVFGTFVGLAGMVLLGGFAAWTIITFVDDASKQTWCGVVAGLAILYYCGNYIEAVWRAPWPARGEAR